MPIEINRDNYEDEVNDSKIPVLAYFWGPKCRPCLTLMPMVEELENNYQDRLKVTKLNAAENRMQCARLRVMGLPAVLLYKDGSEVDRLTGENITINDIKKAIEAIL